MQAFETGYAPVNGLSMYYEIHGSGEPLLLLHGGVGGSAMLAPLLPALASRHRVITVDLQGHGRTADIDRPLRFEWMADDIARLIGYLQLAILPNSTHYSLLDSPLLPSVLLNFFDTTPWGPG